MHMYFIAIVLPEYINEKILHYKNLMMEKYGCRVALKSPAHITIIPPCWLNEEKEQALKNDLDKLSSTIDVFTITSDDFSAFKPRTIFIAVVPNEKLNEVKIKADGFFKHNEFYGIAIDTRPFHPHITIATRDLHKKDFAEAWPHFAERKFDVEWTVTGLSVLRHNKKNW